MKIEAPGLYLDVPEETYHADPVAPMPSLSSSIAKILIDRSPGHAKYAHPKLNPAFTPEEKKTTKAMDRGSAAHKLLLGAGQQICIINAPDYKTKAARQLRDAARANNEIPVLADDHDAVLEMVAAARQQIARIPDLRGIFDDGDAEVTGVWQERDVWCRCRVDWLPRVVHQGGHVIVPDLKTTGVSAHPDDYQRQFFDMGYDIQSAFYERGLKALIPEIRTVEFVFIVVEQEPPHGVSAVSLAGEGLVLAREKVDLAIETWRSCLRFNRWPMYGLGINRIDSPPWRNMASELRKYAMQDRLAKWQAPHEPKQIKGDAA